MYLFIVISGYLKTEIIFSHFSHFSQVAMNLIMISTGMISIPGMYNYINSKIPIIL